MNKTLFLSQTGDADPADQPQPEARMREALGLRSDGTRVAPSPGHRPDRGADHGGSNPRRHRFVQEGEVPVEVMQLRDHSSRGPATPRHRVDEAALTAEKLARELAERAYADVTERLREVQTKLGHAELARDEALAQAAARLAQIEQLQAQLRQPPAPPPLPAAIKAPPKPVGRPRGRQKAPKPVKWWLKETPRSD